MHAGYRSLRSVHTGDTGHREESLWLWIMREVHVSNSRNDYHEHYKYTSLKKVSEMNNDH